MHFISFHLKKTNERAIESINLAYGGRTALLRSLFISFIVSLAVSFRFAFVQLLQSAYSSFH